MTHRTEAFFSKATLLPNKLGVFVYPAINEFLKPEVMAARTMQQFHASENQRAGILAALQSGRFELHNVYLKEGADDEDKLVHVTAEIHEGDNVMEFAEDFRKAIVIGGLE